MKSPSCLRPALPRALRCSNQLLAFHDFSGGTGEFTSLPFRALSGRVKFTVRRHTFQKYFLSARVDRESSGGGSELPRRAGGPASTSMLDAGDLLSRPSPGTRVGASSFSAELCVKPLSAKPLSLPFPPAGRSRPADDDSPTPPSDATPCETRPPPPPPTDTSPAPACRPPLPPPPLTPPHPPPPPLPLLLPQA